ncbi:MAG: ADP compounds hydrolase NudE [Proteobacteria bacterium]|nr:ADP compounds hydrolase NudE [Pseudomonadota bacterium]
MASLPQVLKRRLVAQSRFFRVEEMDLEFANGVRRTYERLQPGRREAVIVVAINDDNEVLLIREYAAGFHEMQLTLPKGATENNETVEEAANRELKEEVGFGARSLTHLKRLNLAPGHMGFTINVVLARDLYPEQLQGDEPEPPEVVPWAYTDLDGLLTANQFNEARAIAALTLVRLHMEQLSLAAH